MTIPLRLEQVTPDEAEFQRWKSAQMAPDDAEFEAWKRKQGLSLSRAPSDATRALARNRPNPTGDLEAASSIPTAVMGAEASLARGLPPLAALQNASRMLLRGQSYDEAKSDIDTATGMLNPVARGVIQGVGAAPAAMLMPAATIPQAIGSGAAFGAMQGGTDDSHASVPDVLKDMGKGAAVGATIAGGTAIGARAVDAGRGLLRNAARAREAPTLGQTSLDKGAEIRRVDNQLYPASEQEANAAGGTSPEIQQSFTDPDVAPYVDVIRNSRLYKGADDATVLREAYKLMSERQGALSKRLVASPDFKAGTSLEARELGAAKGDLKTAGSSIMPSFPQAVDAHAQGAQERDAGRTIADATRRLMRTGGTGIPAAKLDQQSPEAIAQNVKQMTPEQAQEAIQWLFGRAKEAKLSPTLNIKTGFGVGKAATQLNRLSPLINQLDTQAGNAVQKPIDIETMLRLMGAGVAGRP